MEFNIQIHITVAAPDIELANEQYEKIYDILANSGHAPDWGEVGPAIISETLE